MAGTPLSGDPILASDIKIPKYVPKTIAESVTSSTTMQDDNELFVALPVGTWKIELFLHFTCSTAGDIKTGWTTTGTMNVFGRSVIGGGSSMASVTDTTVRLQSLAIGTATSFGGNTSSANYIKEDILVDVTVAGTLQLQWAQNTSDVTATTVVVASRLIYTEVET
jgi:hypothetical protein